LDNLITSRRARWKVFGIILLIICIVGVIKGFVSGRFTADIASPARTPTADAGSTADSLLADIRKRNASAPSTAQAPDALPANFSGWDQSGPKTLTACQTKVYEWQKWYDGNIGVFGDLKTNNDRLTRENNELGTEDSRLRSELKIAEPVGIFSGFLGLGAGIGIIFLLAKWLRRAPQPSTSVSAEKKKLLLLIGGAGWISVAVVICSQRQILYLHPINLLVAVVVYSIPAVLFGGIAFWWLRSSRKP
jgi:hypothetical protein